VITDTERLDWLQEQSHYGCGLINDDTGHWAVSTDGFQYVLMEDAACDIETTFHVPSDEWSNSVREAIDAAMQEDDNG